jgi:hypothetical protein
VLLAVGHPEDVPPPPEAVAIPVETWTPVEADDEAAWVPVELLNPQPANAELGTHVASARINGTLAKVATVNRARHMRDAASPRLSFVCMIFSCKAQF